jgi:hypothetical protein
MRAMAVMEEPIREAFDHEDRPRRRPDARLARLRLAASRGDVDVDAVAAALVRRLRFNATLHAQLSEEG